MSIIHKSFADGVLLTGTAQLLYTVDTGLKGTIEKATFSNSDPAAQSVTLYLIPSGGSAGVANQVEITKTILPGESWSSPHAAGHLLEAGGTIKTTVSKDDVIGCRITGYESTS
jgi:hypothetical protein